MLDSIRNGSISGFEVAYRFDLVKSTGFTKLIDQKSFLDIFVSSLCEGSGTEAEFLISMFRILQTEKLLKKSGFRWKKNSSCPEKWRASA